MTELWQLYNEDGQPVALQGASKPDVFGKGLLHGASHVWIWRRKNGEPEILLQKRAAVKLTWPNCWDISAAGHIDLHEQPIEAAIRETTEELGLDTKAENLHLITKRRDVLNAPTGEIENEWRWVYAFQLEANTRFKLQKTEVSTLIWKNLKLMQQELKDPTQAKNYVPHGDAYFRELVSWFKANASTNA